MLYAQFLNMPHEGILRVIEQQRATIVGNFGNDAL